MSTVTYTNAASQSASVDSDLVWIKAGGANAGQVWVGNPNWGPGFRQATDEEVTALGGITNWDDAVTAAEAISDT